jgi:acyl carrier protein
MSTTADLRATVIAVLAEIAPEADLATLPDDADLREQLDLDSMDVQSLVVGIYEATGVDVPERDYGKLTSVGATVDYLAAA